MLGPPDMLGRRFGLAGAGRPNDAETLVGEIAAVDPDESAARTTLGLLRHRREAWAEACSTSEAAATLVTLEPAARSVPADRFTRTARPEMVRLVDEPPAPDGRMPGALLPTGAAGLGHLGEHGLALGVCLRLARRTPLLPEAHSGVAFSPRTLGRPPAAVLPIVARAHQPAPEVPPYRVSLDTLLDRRDEARELLHGPAIDAVSCRCCIQRLPTRFLPVGESDAPAGAAEPAPST